MVAPIWPSLVSEKCRRRSDPCPGGAARDRLKLKSSQIKGMIKGMIKGIKGDDKRGQPELRSLFLDLGRTAGTCREVAVNSDAGKRSSYANSTYNQDMQACSKL